MKHQVGSKVRCINDMCREDQLTEGKEYTVLQSYNNYLVVNGNNGIDNSFIHERFELVKPSEKLVENEHVYMFDVDDTLILWDDEIHAPGEGRIAVVDPYDKITVYVKPHTRHVKLLTQMKGRGRYVVVWSAAGAKWAQAVVDALGLDHSVDLILTKPIGYVDDLPVDQWMKNRIYIQGDAK